VRQRLLAATEPGELRLDLGGDAPVRRRLDEIARTQRAGDLGLPQDRPEVVRHAHAEPIDAGLPVPLRTGHAQDHVEHPYVALGPSPEP